MLVKLAAHGRCDNHAARNSRVCYSACLAANHFDSLRKTEQAMARRSEALALQHPKGTNSLVQRRTNAMFGPRFVCLTQGPGKTEAPGRTGEAVSRALFFILDPLYVPCKFRLSCFLFTHVFETFMGVGNHVFNGSTHPAKTSSTQGTVKLCRLNAVVSRLYPFDSSLFSRIQVAISASAYVGTPDE